MTDRREFLKKSAQVAAAVAAANAWKATGGVATAFASTSTPALDEVPDSTIKELMAAALTAAKSAGAGYADVRIGRQRQNFVFTREQQITNVVDTDSMGCGVRALVDGTWGFAATRTLTNDGVAAAAKEAVSIAKANRVARDRPVVLAPAPAAQGTWKSAFTKDPWDVSVEEKAALLLKANAEALKVKGVKFIFSGLFFVKEERNYANSEGSLTQQTAIRSWPIMQITAINADQTDYPESHERRAANGTRMGVRGRARSRRTRAAVG